MTTGIIERSTADMLENIRGMRDTLAVSRVFGDPIEVDGTTVIPVARVTGGVGGGGGEGTEAESAGGGFGMGFGVGVQPVGVYEVRDAKVVWRPAVDANRVMKGGQVLLGIVTVCVTLVLLRRQRDTG